MDTYPDLPTDYGSDPKPIAKTGIVIDRAADGTARSRSFGDDKVQIPVKHPRLDATQKAMLDAFYAANRLLRFTYVSKTDGVSRTCMFAGMPAYTLEKGQRWNAAVLLEQA
jgi:hypothetical protein